jgi:IS6 family transposase
VTKPPPAEFKWRQFEPPLILLAVGWYLRSSLSYRDVEELLPERGMSADHVTVWRWVQCYAPELDRTGYCDGEYGHARLGRDRRLGQSR